MLKILRAIFVPLLFIAVHYLMITVSQVMFWTGYLTIVDSTVTDPQAVSELLTLYYPVIAVLFSIPLILIYGLFLYLRRLRHPRTLLATPVRIPHLLAGIAVMIGVVGLTNYWFSILFQISEQNPTVSDWMDQYQLNQQAFGADIGLFWLILGIGILAPVAEELLFRGILIGELRLILPDWVTVLISGVVFAIYHVQPIQVSYVMLPGLLLGLVYVWSGSLWVPIVMHITYNLLGSALPALLGEDQTLQSIVIWSETAFIGVGALALAYLALTRVRHAPAGKLLQQSEMPSAPELRPPETRSDL